MPSMNNSPKNSKQVARRSDHNKKDISKMMRPAKPRDDLHGAFAGEQNKNEAARSEERR